jgi:FAD/FMN-containing dehydrogenase
MRVLLSLLLVITATAAVAVRTPSVARDLEALISTSSSISVELKARWSDFNAPLPAVVVNVATEKDVAAVVR